MREFILKVLNIVLILCYYSLTYDYSINFESTRFYLSTFYSQNVSKLLFLISIQILAQLPTEKNFPEITIFDTKIDQNTFFKLNASFSEVVGKIISKLIKIKIRDFAWIKLKKSRYPTHYLKNRVTRVTRSFRKFDPNYSYIRHCWRVINFVSALYFLCKQYHFFEARNFFCIKSLLTHHPIVV